MLLCRWRGGDGPFVLISCARFAYIYTYLFEHGCGVFVEEASMGFGVFLSVFLFSLWLELWLFRFVSGGVGGLDGVRASEHKVGKLGYIYDVMNRVLCCCAGLVKRIY